ncbi:hypothetical protein ABF231_003371 [Yersinia ruckeri]|uniref:hypothetical protein n=1 Tax=Yersinia ruckeri TaxID=29486 RepID=UPI00223806E5|nr:hypothetical protein [Yersinia ruckeri]EKN4700375.1 hypothetical protein [Yersinia ruckeri]MCW6585902.1 hypothetical protein [Yersinia ruckeri]
MSDNNDIHDDQSDNVLAFTKRFNENADIKEMLNFVKAEPAQSQDRRCTHSKILVDDHLRQLTCRLCGAVVEAFDWINSVTKNETKVDWELKGLRGEIKQHREGLEKLKREEVNCRARIKNAAFKLNDINLQISKAESDLRDKSE